MKYAFRHDGKAFILKAEDGSTVRVGPRHEKYDYVQGVEAGRVIGISKSGRWTNATDYHDLYEKVGFGKAPSSASKKSAAKAKPAPKPAAKAKSALATKTSTAKHSSSADAKRIQAMDVQISSLELQVKDLKRRLSASETKARNAESQVEKLQSQLAAARKPVPKPKPKPKPKKVVSKKKREAVEYRVEYQVKYQMNWPASFGKKSEWEYWDSSTTVNHDAQFMWEYERLTKSALKSEFESLIDRRRDAISIGGWKGSFYFPEYTYGVKRVSVRILSMEKKEHRDLQVL